MWVWLNLRAPIMVMVTVMLDYGHGSLGFDDVVTMLTPLRRHRAERSYVTGYSHGGCSSDSIYIATTNGF